MTDPTTTTSAAATTVIDAPAPAPESIIAPAAPPAPPVSPAAPVAARPSRSWMGVVILFVAVATLAGATIALFVRVQEAQQTADDAVVLAGNQDALNARIDELDATLASIESEGSTAADQAATARDQVGALRKCVNNAIDGWSQATQSGKPVSIAKC